MIVQSPILVTGIPRSGASMIAATIKHCGAFTGDLSKRSMYNNITIKEELVSSYLKMLEFNHSYNWNWKEDVEFILSRQGWKGEIWMYKDSNISKMWKVWASAYPNAKYVIVRRKTTDVIESCLKTGYMKEHSTREGWLGMVHAYENNFVEMITEGLNCKVIWPERMVNGDYNQLYELCDWIGLPWKEDALKFIDTLLWKSRQLERR